MTDWISVKDRLPDDDEDVNLRVRFTWVINGMKKMKYVMAFVGNWQPYGWCINNLSRTGYEELEERTQELKGVEIIREVTHWAPLPPDPQEK